MSETQAVYNAEVLAETCTRIAERLEDVVSALQYEQLISAARQTPYASFVLMRLGERIDEINDQADEIAEDVRELARQAPALERELKDVEEKLGVGLGFPTIALPDANSSAEFLVQLGGLISWRRKRVRDAANIMRSMAHGLRHAGEEGQEQ